MKKLFVMKCDGEELKGDYNIVSVYDSYKGCEDAEGYVVYELEVKDINSITKTSNGVEFRPYSINKDGHIESWEQV